MELGIAAMLFAAGVAGGGANALAGGGSLLTFPALLAAGLPPVVANATNALAASPAHPMAAWTERARLPPVDAAFRRLLGVQVVGGALGAGLLLVTPGAVFAALVPVLIGFATLVFAFAGPLQRLLGLGSGGFDAQRAVRFGWPLAVYGGYFGAGLGIMLMAVLRLSGEADAARANALKNLLASLAVLAGLVLLLAAGLVAWPEAMVVLAGSVLGGWLGGRASRVLPAGVIRTGVIVAGAAMTLVTAARFW
jgi:uncharacterized membrane protein YfcA